MHWIVSLVISLQANCVRRMPLMECIVDWALLSLTLGLEVDIWHAPEPWKDWSDLVWGYANLERLQAMDITICVGRVDIEPVNCVRDLGVLLDSSLSVHQHIAIVTSTCFLHLSTASQAQPHTCYRRPKATCLHCNTDPCRLLQLCACLSVWLCSGTAVASTSRGHVVFLGLAATDRTTSQLHCRHYTGYLCVNVLLTSCAHWCTVLPSDMCLLIYFMLWYHSRCYQEERICGWQTMDSTTYHGCHRRSVPQLSPLRVRVLGISYPYLCIKWTVSRR